MCLLNWVLLPSKHLDLFATKIEAKCREKTYILPWTVRNHGRCVFFSVFTRMISARIHPGGGCARIHAGGRSAGIQAGGGCARIHAGGGCARIEKVHGVH